MAFLADYTTSILSAPLPPRGTRTCLRYWKFRAGISSSSLILESRFKFHLRGLDVDIRGTAALITLGSDNLIVVVTEAHALGGPSIKVVLHVNAAAGALRLADRPVLVKGLSTIDGGLVVTSGLSNSVGTAVGGESALLRGLAGGIVRAEALNDVVLDQRAAGPSVHGQVAVALRRERAAVVDGANPGRQ